MDTRTKLIEIIDPQAGKIRETYHEPAVPVQEDNQWARLFENKQRLLELASTSQFPVLLKSGLRSILFSAYAGIPLSHEMWAMVERSNGPDEQWLEGNSIGTLPIVPEGKEYPTIELKLDRAVKIVNQKRGGIINVTREMVAFDKVNQIRQMVQDLGAAMARTEENDAYTVLTTANNYTRNSTTSDNDIGANTADVTLSATGFETAYSTLRTMKDRHSGAYIGVSPDTLVIGPRNEFYAKQLFLSDTVDGMGDTDAIIRIGTGTSNPLRGLIRRIIVSPYLSASYAWVLMEAGKAVVKQVVWDLELSQDTDASNGGSAFDADVWRYRASKMYGIGMLNDRFAFYSSTSTQPTVT